MILEALGGVRPPVLAFACAVLFACGGAGTEEAIAVDTSTPLASGATHETAPSGPQAFMEYLRELFTGAQPQPAAVCTPEVASAPARLQSR